MIASYRKCSLPPFNTLYVLLKLEDSEIFCHPHIPHLNWLSKDGWIHMSIINCLAKAVHSLARRRTGQCLSMRACVCKCVHGCLVWQGSRSVARSFYIPLCETQLSAEDRSFFMKNKKWSNLALASIHLPILYHCPRPLMQ